MTIEVDRAQAQGEWGAGNVSASVPRDAPLGRLSLALQALLAIALAAALTAHAYVGLFSRYMADDFCYTAQMRTQSLWQSESQLYMHWTGRFSTVVLWWIFYRSGTWTAPLLATLIIAAWIGAVSWALRGLPGRWRAGRSGFQLFLIAEAIVLAGLELNPSPAQTLYWIDGFVPFFAPLILCTALAGVVVRQLRAEPTGPRAWIATVAACVIAFVGGGFSEPYVALQSSLLLCALVALLRLPDSPRRKSARRTISAALAASCLAAVVSVGAPGNWTRFAAEGDNHHSVLLRALFVLPVGVLVLGFALVPMLKAGLVLGSSHVLLSTRESGQAGGRRGGWRASVPRLTAFTFLLMLGLVFVAVAPATLATGSGPPGRALVVAWFVPLCALVTWQIGLTVRGGTRVRRWPDGERRQLLNTAVVLCGLAVALWSTTDTLQRLPAEQRFAAQWDNRDRLLQADRSHLRLTPVIAPIAETSGLEVAGPDPRSWVNSCIAGYYGLRTLRVVRGSGSEVSQSSLRGPAGLPER